MFEGADTAAQLAEGQAQSQTFLACISASQEGNDEQIRACIEETDPEFFQRNQ